MKKTLFTSYVFIPLVLLSSCDNNSTKEKAIAAHDLHTTKDSINISGTPCDIKLQKIHFIKSVNFADTLIKID